MSFLEVLFWVEDNTASLNPINALDVTFSNEEAGVIL